MNRVKNMLTTFLLTCLVLSLTGCFEEEERLYDILGGVATISVWTPSKTNPAPNELMTVRARYYSEHEPVKELRFYAKVGAADRVLVETVAITGHDVKNSYERTFNYTVPDATPSQTVIVFTIEVENNNGLINSRATPSTGNTAVRTS